MEPELPDYPTGDMQADVDRAIRGPLEQAIARYVPRRVAADLTDLLIGGVTDTIGRRFEPVPEPAPIGNVPARDALLGERD